MANFRTKPQETENTGPTLYLKDKDEHEVVFLGDPYEYEVVWSGKGSVPVAPGTEGAKFRFRWNVFLIKEKVVKIHENGFDLFKKLYKIQQTLESKGVKEGINATKVILSRTGSGPNDTEYHAVNFERLSEKESAYLKKLKLHDLAPVAQAKPEPEPAFDNQAAPWPDEAQQGQEEPDLPF